MKKKKKQNIEKKAHPWLIVWGLIAAAAAGFMLFAACDMARKNEGLSTPALTACLSVLFFLISVMVNRRSPQPQNWPDALFFTLTAEAVTELILLPLLGKMIHISEIILFILTAAAAGLLFWKRRTTGLQEDLRIPLILGIIGAGTGIFMMNTIAYMIFNGGDASRLWLAIFLAAIFLLFSVFLAESALGQKNGKALFVCFAAAFLVQLAALIYSRNGYYAPTQLTFQKIAAALLFAAALFSFIAVIKKKRNGSAA